MEEIFADRKGPHHAPEAAHGGGGVRARCLRAAGVAGFEITKTSEWPSVKAVHGWILMLEPDSVFRTDLVNWESKISKGA